MRAAVFERYRDELEVVRCVSRVEILPAWQLFPAASPGAPEEEQKLLPAKRGKIEISAVEQGQRDVR